MDDLRTITVSANAIYWERCVPVGSIIQEVWADDDGEHFEMWEIVEKRHPDYVVKRHPHAYARPPLVKF